MMDTEEQYRGFLAPSPEYLASVKVFPLIPAIKKDVTANIDSALSWDQLTASDINFALVRPLVFKYAKLKNLAAVYACLVVRAHFLHIAAEDLAFSGIMIARGNLCEIMAMKLLGHISSDRVQLVAVLTSCWSPLAGAPPDIINEVRDALGGDDDDMNDPQCALEVAISSRAKTFLSSPVVQTVVDDIYSGRVVFSMTGHRSVLADNYKPRGIEIYDPRKAPFLDHYRLRVPKYNAILEFLNFAVLMFTFILCLSTRNVNKMDIPEIIFVVFAVSFTLAEYTASKEHGWGIYIANMWNVFDASFILIFICYLILRVSGLLQHDTQSSELAFDILSCGACILFPRLAFFAIRSNIVVIALRGMIAEFVFFMGIAAICFSGLLFTLSTLDGGAHWTMRSIMWLMVQIWFGNTYLSFGQASSFHPFFGPILMTCFAALSNTLLLTILISILSNTFARIDANATQEYLFQFAITTIEGVKSDALFSYQPPFNLMALVILWPSSFVLSPRALHTFNVFLIRLTSFPVLIVIQLYERWFAVGKGFRETGKGAAQSLYHSLPRRIKNVPILDAIMGSSAGDVYDAIFDIECAPDEFDDLFQESDDERPALRSFTSREGLRPQRPLSPLSGKRRPSPSKSPMRDGGPSPGNSPRPRRPVLPQIEPFNSTEIPSLGKASPLAKLFTPRRQQTLSQPDFNAASSATNDARMKRMEAMLEDIRELPVQKLKDEMKELQDRQARIENLLLMLTRGMRNETGSHTTSRHDTLS
ncbi:hypothetical protein JAAARDRAFT_35597 [Jaapia argillacea MUCL 33604]|uniref:Polycystin cation channel PKD1/PKD2 domain-containing protein n=1 Tax=Jaapia argillacea MUCL 33604 TaxID=933084 RepID=A0A067Q0J1_9AGAM|nr:hypothetical protein JAAARDRAFT_35597 [Jaapia argillacea MUCL 33604]